MASSRALWSFRAAFSFGAASAFGFTLVNLRDGKGLPNFAQCSTKFETDASPSKTNSFDATRSAFDWDFNWDKRQEGPSEDKSVQKAARTMKHYIFIRHGDYNTRGSIDEEKSLTKLGQDQAMLTGIRLASLGLNYTKIIQSTMTRAKETCSIISKSLPDIQVSSTDLLREGGPIAPVPPNRANEPELKYHSDGPRIEAAFRKYVHRPTLNETGEPAEIYVCHANVIRYFVCRALQFPPKGWLRISLRHGSITWLTVYSDGDVVVRCIGDAGFMPSSKLSR